jgi:hypothetical protein
LASSRVRAIWPLGGEIVGLEGENCGGELGEIAPAVVTSGESRDEMRSVEICDGRGSVEAGSRDGRAVAGWRSDG